MLLYMQNYVNFLNDPGVTPGMKNTHEMFGYCVEERVSAEIRVLHIGQNA